MEEVENVVIIPIKDRSKETLGACRTNNGTTVIDITKPKKTESFVYKFCSFTLKSLYKLKKCMEQMHGKEKLFFCSECSPKQTEGSSKIPQDFSLPWK